MVRLVEICTYEELVRLLVASMKMVGLDLLMWDLHGVVRRK